MGIWSFMSIPVHLRCVINAGDARQSHNFHPADVVPGKDADGEECVEMS